MTKEQQPQQTSLPLSLSPSGLTEWLNGSPPCAGWWETRPSWMEMEPVPGRPRVELSMRRWFDGATYSLEVGPWMTDEEAATASRIVGNNCPSTLQYRGLSQMPDELYSYALDPRHRTYLARQTQGKQRVLLEE